MTQENYDQLKQIIKDKCLETSDLLDVMSDQDLKDAVEHFSEHCNCGNRLTEHEQESGICKECI